MHIVIKTTNVDKSPSLSDYIEKKLGTIKKLIGGTDEETAMIDVEIGKVSNHHRSGDIFKAEVNYCLRGTCYRAVAEGENLYAAIDEIKDEITRSLSVDKKKKLHALRRGSQKIKNILKGITGQS